MNFDIIRITERPELKTAAAEWFHEKWGIPYEAYLESMEEAMSGKGAVPQWYLALYGDRIAAGMGVIANDFHDRTDLTPNVCAVFTEPDFRCQGLAGRLLGFVADDMKSGGIDALYLLTSHDSFYERYGWEFVTMAECTDGSAPVRLSVSPRE